MAQIITPKYLESLRSSDYKNSMYAFAEIIDNSIDARATTIEVLFKTRLVQNRIHIDDVFFIDNGDGIDHSQLNRVVIFSVTGNVPGDGKNKTGRFGVGLPNSSFSQTKTFSVASKNDSDEWASVSVDLNRMIIDDSLEVPNVTAGLDDSLRDILTKSCVDDAKTVVRWRNPDQLDFSDPKKFYPKIEPLLGRIYRYFLLDAGVKIQFTTIEHDNDSVFTVIRPYDPNFLISDKSLIYDILVSDIKADPMGDGPKRPKEYLEPFIQREGGIALPLYQELTSSTHSNIKVKYRGHDYFLSIKASYAYKNVQKPGMNAPGNIGIGKAMRKKMVGGKYGPGGNISWVRNKREIDCGNYNLFNVSDEKNRWWSIEISYDTSNDPDNVLDRLLGLSNTKQSFKFKPSTDPTTIHDDTSHESVARTFLMGNLTIEINTAIRELRKKLAAQASAYKREIEPSPEPGGFPGPQPGTQRVLLDALGRGEQLTEQEKKNLVEALGKHLPGVPIDNIKSAVNLYSDIGIKNIPIYCQLHRNVFFESQSFQGRVLTLINTEHPYYRKIIQPLKEKGATDLIVSSELLISTLTKSAVESPENHQSILESYQQKIANTLSDLLTRQDELIEDLDNEEDDD